MSSTPTFDEAQGLAPHRWRGLLSPLPGVLLDSRVSKDRLDGGMPLIDLDQSP